MRGATSEAARRTEAAAVFQSTRPMRGATADVLNSERHEDVSIHAPHAGRDDCQAAGTCSLSVSIHAPHAGRDDGYIPVYELRWGFNPRAPCGARPHWTIGAHAFGEFQSTRPMRGATYVAFPLIDEDDVSIHAPHAGRDSAASRATDYWTVSIHAPHAGRDSGSLQRSMRSGSFNPRAPCGARPVAPLMSAILISVSIHAPHAGRDIPSLCPYQSFQVSIHAPHAGRDPYRRAMKSTVSCFNPRAPCGARLNLMFSFFLI